MSQVQADMKNASQAQEAFSPRQPQGGERRATAVPVACDKRSPMLVSEAAVEDSGFGTRAANSSLASRIRGLARKNADVVATVATSFGIFCLFAIQGVFLARLLGPRMRAEYGTVVLYTQTLTYIGLLGALLSIAAHAARNGDRLPGLRRAALRLGVLTGVGTALIVTVLSLTALPASKAYLAGLCIVCSVLLPFDHMRLALMAVDHGSGNFSKYNRNAVVNAALLPLSLGLFWLLDIRSVQLIVAVTIAIPLVSLAYRFLSEGTGIIGPRSEPPIRALLVEGIPYGFAQTASDLFNRLDALLVLWLVGLTDQGYYMAAVSAAGLMAVAPNALALFSFRSSAASDRAGSVGKLVAAGLAVSAIQAVTLLAILAVIERLITLVFGSNFRGAVPYATILMTAQAVGGLTFVAGGYLRGRGKSFVEVWTRVIGAGVIIAIALGLRSGQGQMSVPIAVLCGQTICAMILCAAVLHDAVRQPSRVLANSRGQTSIRQFRRSRSTE